MTYFVLSYLEDDGIPVKEVIGEYADMSLVEEVMSDMNRNHHVLSTENLTPVQICMYRDNLRHGGVIALEA